MNPDAKQVVTIAPDGAISSLRRKDGLDLRQFGNVEIQRVSDIKWDSCRQGWYIAIIYGPRKGIIVGPDDWLDCNTPWPKNCYADLDSGVIIFGEYEEAVEAEIRFLDALRKQGVF